MCHVEHRSFVACATNGRDYDPRVRLLSRLLTALSLLACVATAVLWGRSVGSCDVLVRPRGAGDRVCVTSEFGLLVFEVEAATPGVVREGWEYFHSPLPRRWPVRRGLLPVEAYRGRVTHFVRLPPTELWGVAVPHWPVVVLAAALPARALVRVRRGAVARRRGARGLCPGCGYDLRATPGRCPECGRGATLVLRRSGPSLRREL